MQMFLIKIKEWRNEGIIRFYANFAVDKRKYDSLDVLSLQKVISKFL
jgi:hypothetical protein